MRSIRSRRSRATQWDVQAGDVFVLGEGPEAVRLLVHCQLPPDVDFHYVRVFARVVDEHGCPTQTDLSDPEGTDSSIPVGRPAEPVSSFDDFSEIADVIAAGAGIEGMLTPGVVILVPGPAADVDEPHRAGFTLERRGGASLELHGHAVMLTWAELSDRLTRDDAGSR